ncbi:ORF29-DNA packaging terminase [Eptesicus fuscus gammaherpesvirus]|uniref:ORF29-DNA packaging terminase n=1 Tax=vespertilionid gammaherpesvirus 3 TaxID=2846598 RepID=A0A2D1A8S6_9GAMA|nr:ORF29-DNA packaging terminase [Eptesicus fuscus gammaherpesvirus]ATA58258.1 ORF29-DNA packaging terminase [Eptesicus fuscus gammaherpesvirus]
MLPAALRERLRSNYRHAMRARGLDQVPGEAGAVEAVVRTETDAEKDLETGEEEAEVTKEHDNPGAASAEEEENEGEGYTHTDADMAEEEVETGTGGETVEDPGREAGVEMDDESGSGDEEGGARNRPGWALHTTPAIVAACPKSERTANPYVGVLQGATLYSAMMGAYCTECNPAHADDPDPEVGTYRVQKRARFEASPGLSQLLPRLCAALSRPEDTESHIEFAAAVQTHQAALAAPEVQELRRFLINLSSFLNGCYAGRATSVEPFQKQLILHTFYFLISIKAPESTNRLFDIFKEYFGLLDMPGEKLQTFKQKSSIFLIPRRHGKTWIVVAIISMLLASVEDIHVGYVAHQKHVANAVFAEIINTLCRWFPPKRVEVKKENGTIVFRHETGRASTLMCATCFNKNVSSCALALGSYTLACASRNVTRVAGPTGWRMLQRDAKIIFISSVNSADQATSFLYRLRNASERMLNVVSYVCPDHREDFNLQESLVSCPCYRLHIPAYITIDESIKTTTNLFLEGAFTTELMGDASTVSRSTMHRVVGEAALEQFDLCRVDTTGASREGGDERAGNELDNTLYIYIDPAYSNNSEASGTGVGAVVALRNRPGRALLLGLEHFFLRDLTGAATAQIAACAATLVRSVAILHPGIRSVNVAVEGNSSQDSAVAIATYLNECCPLPAQFLHYTDRASGLQWPMFMLNNEKSPAFEGFIYALNAGTLSASQSTVSNTIKLSYDPVSYLLEQVKAIRCYPLRDGGQSYCAKTKTMADDALVAVVMAHYFATSDRYLFRPLCARAPAHQ